MKLESKFLLIILPSLFLTVSVLSVVEYWFLLQDDRQAVRQQVELQHRNWVRQGNQRLELEIAQLRAISKIGEMDDYLFTSNAKLREVSLKPRLMFALDELTRELSSFKRISLYDIEHQQLIMVGENVDPFADVDNANLALLQRLQAYPHSHVDSELRNNHGALTFRLAERFSPSLIRTSQSPAASGELYTLVAEVDRLDVADAIEELYLKQGIALLVFDRERRFIFGPSSMPWQVGNADLFQQLEQKLIRGQSLVLDNVGEFQLVSQLTSGDSISIAMVSESIENQDANAYLWRVILLFLVTFLLLFILLRWAIKRTVVTPLMMIRQRIRGVEEGIDEDVPLSKGGDELAELNNSFADMVTSVRQAKTALEKVAYSDRLTGLNNRLVLQRSLGEGLESKMALLILDIDRFKHLNETHGDKGGDQILKSLSELVQSMMAKPPFDELIDHRSYVARTAGNEFAILLFHANLELAESLAEQLVTALADPVVVGAGQVYLQVSIGIAASPQHTETVAELQKLAEAAKQQAKLKGGAQYQVFSQQIAEYLLEKEVIERALTTALEQDEFELFFQPYVCSKTGLIAGAEALLRWQSESLGRVGPDKFIPVAEQSGLIYAIDRWVIEHACRSLAEILKTQQNSTFSMSVNVSNTHLQQPGLADFISGVVSAMALPPKQVEIEITETATADLDDRFLANANALKKLGVGLVLDDFGTGYTSLAHLGQLPVTKLKLDRTHTAEIGLKQPADTPGVAKIVLEFAHAYNLSVTAEGVENQQQLDFLNSEKCDFIQGYYLYKPMNFNQLLELLNGKG
ncbi:putative bifunctional diguanylate cyclase/phosphodiesterase [Corallincola spongiicola]|uniref:Sensor domain-containing phosphodiesterase n=1 Tax=Corallincola spongiicola TaxID=2520508 RepID=A0ABY1WNK2_9GAMM|nr:GGDEF domain-containing phosphodiesterase [Corallincola spongiicola]TAA45062.1 sensor domain-containing phosphodiesterase [Corallincola spongiicola]